MIKSKALKLCDLCGGEVSMVVPLSAAQMAVATLLEVDDVCELCTSRAQWGVKAALCVEDENSVSLNTLSDWLRLIFS